MIDLAFRSNDEENDPGKCLGSILTFDMWWSSLNTLKNEILSQNLAWLGTSRLIWIYIQFFVYLLCICRGRRLTISNEHIVLEVIDPQPISIQNVLLILTDTVFRWPSTAKGTLLLCPSGRVTDERTRTPANCFTAWGMHGHTADSNINTDYVLFTMEFVQWWQRCRTDLSGLLHDDGKFKSTWGALHTDSRTRMQFHTDGNYAATFRDATLWISQSNFVRSFLAILQCEHHFSCFCNMLPLSTVLGPLCFEKWQTKSKKKKIYSQFV